MRSPDFKRRAASEASPQAAEVPVPGAVPAGDWLRILLCSCYHQAEDRFFGGRRERWPRHSEAPDPEPFFAPQVFGKAYETEALHKQTGDQLATLALRRAAGALEAKVTYHEVHESPRRSVEVSLGLLRDGA